MHRRQKGIFKITTTALLVVFLSYFIPAFAARAAVGVPEEVTYQGRLLDGSGNLLGGSSGTDYCFKFSFFDDETVGGGDAQLWPAGAPSTMTIEVTEGVFTAGIGDVGAGGDLLDFNFQSTDEAYLNVEVGDQVAGSCALAVFENLSPRQRIRSSGYAINAGTLEGMGAADFLASAGDTATGDFDFSGASLQTGSPLVFEGATADAFETTFAMTDPTADRTITFQDASGTVAFLSDIAGSQNLFETIATTSGTAPVADSATDTLSLSAGSANITVTGDSITDTVTLDIADSYLFNTGDVATGNYDFSGAVFFGAAPWVLEGATADTFELTLALVDPTADQTITFPDVTGTVVTTGDTGSVTGAMIANGSVDISNDTNLSNGTNTTVNGDSIDVNDVFLMNTGDTGTGDYDFTGAVLQGASPLVFEGGTVDAFESTFAFADPTSDIGTNLWEDGAMGVFEDDKAVIVGTDVAFSFASGGIGDLRVADEIEVIGNAYIGSDAADTVTLNATILGGSPFVFEGATANAFETTLAITDPTADRVITVPDVTGTVVTTGDAGSVTGTMIANGSVDISDDTNLSNGTNTTVSGDSVNVNDVFLFNTGDTGTGNYDFTGAVYLGASPLVFEGGTVDAFESTFAFADFRHRNESLGRWRDGRL
ncbi:hypothetical protein HYV73_00240 [Candidatus Uhrbacteria bacterium]|nr:hypothetical protein [Candidatus Uhrbacteria bacterium]